MLSIFQFHKVPSTDLKPKKFIYYSDLVLKYICLSDMYVYASLCPLTTSKDHFSVCLSSVCLSQNLLLNKFWGHFIKYLQERSVPCLSVHIVIFSNSMIFVSFIALCGKILFIQYFQEWSVPNTPYCEYRRNFQVQWFLWELWPLCTSSTSTYLTFVSADWLVWVNYAFCGIRVLQICPDYFEKKTTLMRFHRRNWTMTTAYNYSFV